MNSLSLLGLLSAPSTHTPWRSQLGMCEKLPEFYSPENLFSLISFARLSPPSCSSAQDGAGAAPSWPYVCM